MSGSYHTYDLGDYYAILPHALRFKIEEYIDHFNAKSDEPGFRYNSGENTECETVESLRELIKKHIDSNFSINGGEQAQK